MILAFVTVVILFFGGIMHERGELLLESIRFLGPLMILIPLGICDDKWGLRAKTKFCFQIGAAIFAWILGFRLSNFLGCIMPPWACLILTIVWIVGFINAFNMIDGVDGLAAGVGIISAVCMAVVALSKGHFGFATVLFIFVGAALGFLYFNWHPARVFMGDTGSMFIGYVLSVSGLILNARLASVSSIAVPILACGIPVVDMLFAVWRRLLGNPTAASDTFPQNIEAESEESWHPTESIPMRLLRILGRLGTADQRHLHHRLLIYYNRNQRKTVWSIYFLELVMGVAGIICCFTPDQKLTFSLIILLCTFGFIINRLAFIELWQTTEFAYLNFQSARTGVIISYIINPIADLVFIVFSYFFASQNTHLDTGELLRYVAICMAILITSRPYRVFWNLAVSDDYFRLIRSLILGFFVCRLSDFLLVSHHVTRLHSYAACVAICLIMLERLFIHYLRNWQVRRFGTSRMNNSAKIRTLLIGVSPLARFYRNRLLSDIERAGSEQLIGIVVMESRFLHSYCFGMKVLGTIDRLEEVFDKHTFDKIVITGECPDHVVDILKTFCKEHHLTLQRFYSQLDTLEIGAPGPNDNPT